MYIPRYINITCNYRSYCPEIEGQENFGGKIRKCSKQKEFKRYSAEIRNEEIGNAGTETLFNTSMNIQFIFELVSKKRNVYEEVLMIDEIGLVGSLGGSLGLFVGFFEIYIIKYSNPERCLLGLSHIYYKLACISSKRLSSCIFPFSSASYKTWCFLYLHKVVLLLGIDI